MTTEEELSTLRDELFRRVGRNLLGFQRIEGMLKFLVANVGLAGPITELARTKETHTNIVRQSTMGILASRLLNEFLSDIGDSDADANAGVGVATSETWVSFKVTIEMDAASRASLGDDIRALVEERNQLVHNFYSQWDGTTIESTRAALDHLDIQRERLRPVFERLRELTQNTKEGMKAHADFLSSPEGEKTFEHLWLCNSPIVKLLVECSARLRRDDGWLPLATAGHVLKRDLPEDVAAMRERYGYSSLKKLVLATDMFDVWDEPIPGGFRSVYRSKSSGE